MTGETIAVDVDPSDTIEKVETKIHDEEESSCVNWDVFERG